jgi:hypothetical protein
VKITWLITQAETLEDRIGNGFFPDLKMLLQLTRRGSMKEATSQNGTKNTKPITFHTTILRTGKNTTGIQVPEEIIEKLSPSKRPLVRLTIKKYTYRSAVAVMGGKFMVGVTAENRQAAGVQGGEEVDVTIELDLEPRTVEIPNELKAALTEAGTLEAFENSAPSMQKEYVRQVKEAKAQETRERRIAKIVEKLSGDR